MAVLFLKRHGAGAGTADTAAAAVRLKQEGSEAFAVVVVFLMSTHQHCWVAFEALNAAAARGEEEALAEAFMALSEVASSWRTPPPGAPRSTRRCCRRRPPRVACLGSEVAADDEALLVFTGAAGGAM